MFNKKEKVLNIVFDKIPEVHVRVIENSDSKIIIENKKKYPFKLLNSVMVEIETTKRKFKFNIFNGYIWNGADIPRLFWRIIGSRTDNDFLIASMLHDFMLEFKVFLVKEVLKNNISKKEYRRLTTLVFRHIIKKQGTNTIKANVMAWCIDIFQIFNIRSWQCL